MKTKTLGLIVLFAAVAAVIFMVLPGNGKELTASSFPKKIQGYVIADLKADEQTNKASGVFLGVKEKVNKSFMATYKAPGAVVTLWVIVLDDPSKELIAAQQLAENMTKQGTMFKNFNTISVDDKPVVTFSGPMDKMENYVFFKNGKVFWAAVVTKGNAKQAFDAFYKEF